MREKASTTAAITAFLAFGIFVVGTGGDLGPALSLWAWFVTTVVAATFAWAVYPQMGQPGTSGILFDLMICLFAFPIVGVIAGFITFPPLGLVLGAQVAVTLPFHYPATAGPLYAVAILLALLYPRRPDDPDLPSHRRAGFAAPY
ncbi:hypothetical protein AADZ90_012250 [Aestuariibius sp. 2305UL40-4]|uniref:hypothetical protein n=1 Tax=Aestuariibius violaceus TaxID=3234132 RepID=UPI00345E2CF5